MQGTKEEINWRMRKKKKRVFQTRKWLQLGNLRQHSLDLHNGRQAFKVCFLPISMGKIYLHLEIKNCMNQKCCWKFQGYQGRYYTVITYYYIC